MITIKDLVESGVVQKVGKDGVKLLGTQFNYPVTTPFHLEITRASQRAIEAIEKLGGDYNLRSPKQACFKGFVEES